MKKTLFFSGLILLTINLYSCDTPTREYQPINDAEKEIVDLSIGQTATGGAQVGIFNLLSMKAITIAGRYDYLKRN